MPPRARRDKRRRVTLTPSRALALTIGPDPSGDEPDDVLAVVWAAHRDDLLATQAPGSRPWAWWRWEPGVPEPLRGSRRVLVPVGGSEAASEAARRLREDRAAWLAEGHAPPLVAC